ncbi:EAL domain-containing protein (plasmid) [Rhizobium sp. CB3060]|nr:EAL domain-containing protein [Rhizobium tropici]
MQTIIGCIVEYHNPWLVILAALLCVSGSWVTARLFQRTSSAAGGQRYGWLFMTALAAGVAIWCTHFVAILGYDAHVPIDFDPILTVVSLFVAVLGSTFGFMVASDCRARFMPALGGAIVGLAVAAMHFAGMMAYRVQGIVSWNKSYLAVALVLSVVLSALSLHLGMRARASATTQMAGTLALAIVSLHFTGMTAFRVEPLLVAQSFSTPEALHTLAVAIAAMSFVIIGSGLVSHLIDDSVRADSMERLRSLALNDPLTGLPNRVNFNERIDLEMSLAGERAGRLALVCIDLDRFKEINDLRGHAAGDEVLRALGRRIKDLLREDEGEFIARTGGDEFIALYRMTDTGDLSDFLARLQTALFGPIQFDGTEIMPGASLGVAIHPDDAASKESLINLADLAMYRAKADPSRYVCFYEVGMDDKIQARRRLSIDLRQALFRNELSLHYQVQTTIATSEIRGYEAVLRWEHPRLGQIAPTEFIPIAEENGLIIPLGAWVLRTACAEAATWELPHKVAVNLSAQQLRQPNLPRNIMEVLMETGLAPERLELELTESIIFADRERALHTLRQIKALGVSIALDEFGTGYSSLDTLRAFPFDKIKIDRSLFSTSTANQQTAAVVQAALALGRSFGIPVLAEAIETYDQLSLLKASGCEEVQGFLFGEPVAFSKIVPPKQPSIATHVAVEREAERSPDQTLI